MSHCLILGWAIGYPELLIVGVVVLLLFGHRLPSVMRSLGRGVVEFKKGVHGDADDDEESAAPAESGEPKVQKG
jgi:sec-independent protein translocase protein TatA